MSYSRYAVYYLPPPGPLADFGAHWLGWDAAIGRAVDQPAFDGVAAITQAPRKYGFHGTLKPPFRLAEDKDADDLAAGVADLAAATPPAQAEALALTRLGRFLALMPVGHAEDIARIAAACVRDLDAFRAPPEEAELARRRKAGLTERQDAHLMRWGYPHVMEDFRFHLTLTGRLDEADLRRVTAYLDTALPALPRPFRLDQIALVGERADGCFELVHRYALAG